MIKICSLDFLNKETFETDVMTADGQVLFHSGEKITPEILLRLYFNEIYVEKSPLEPEQKVVFISTPEETISGPRSIKTDSEPETEGVAVGPRRADLTLDNETEQASGPRFAETFIKEEKISSGPRMAEFNIDEEEKISSSGPRAIETNIPDIHQEKGPRHAFAMDGSDLNAEAEDSADTSENQPLKFDEKQAKRIVDYSLKLGKMLNFSSEELKELEQVAYYCNIGIDEFKKSDLSKKGFSKMKAYASYERLLSTGIVSSKIAEMVKFSANAYESDSFALNSQIPFYHIVALASYYEELLTKNVSKEDALLKMLQMGGNHFNVFILHKFIKIMREVND